MIFVMGVTMLKMDRGRSPPFIFTTCADWRPLAKAKWRIKLERAFEGKRMSFFPPT